ncbi:MAG: undecaprenyl-diphosphate phosphatase [SAR202 cluster bacterium]|jgi:undecaprenyl-diphosphatase|nr:undecaprenyl-diphosphate phosphatase [SAR202 cluster bacterium]
MLESILLGLIQGITEWLPVSSEGLVTASATFLLDKSLEDAIGISLWLHLGTALAALFSFKVEILKLTKGFIGNPSCFKGEIGFLFLGTAVSALIGLPLLLFAGEIFLSDPTKNGIQTFTALIGIFMIVTGVILLRSKRSGKRKRNDSGTIDAMLTGTAQGFSVLPGLSRSGLTVSVLLARGMDRRDALTLSFLLSIPAGIGAGLYTVFSTGIILSPEHLVAVGMSFITGLVTIRILLKLADRINFGVFVISVGMLLASNIFFAGLI